MNSRDKFGLNDAYEVESPADNMRLYARWAQSYDADFVTSNGYVSFLRVAEQLANHVADRSASTLDVGCGTGVVGAALRERGFENVDGIDISAQMLDESRRKRTSEGRPVYRNLYQADLTREIALADNSYLALVSAGTFTHGHLGPESFAELWRVCAPGAICSIGINAQHFKTLNFGEKLRQDVEDGVITSLSTIEADMYTSPGDDIPVLNRTAIIVSCRVQ